MVEIENVSEQELVKAVYKMSDDELHLSAVRTSERERKITLALLRHLNEIERRHLFSKFNASSLHAYCVKELKMDDGTAGRRVSAARLLRDIPVIEEKILTGAVSLTSVAQASNFFRKEARNGNSFSIAEKEELVLKLDDKTTREVDLILLANSDQPEIHFKEKITQKTETTTEVRLHFDQETMEVLTRLKEIWSHADPFANLACVIKRAAKEAVEKHDPLKKIERAEVKLNKKQAAAKQFEPSVVVGESDRSADTQQTEQSTLDEFDRTATLKAFEASLMGSTSKVTASSQTRGVMHGLAENQIVRNNPSAKRLVKGNQTVSSARAESELQYSWFSDGLQNVPVKTSAQKFEKAAQKSEKLEKPMKSEMARPIKFSKADIKRSIWKRDQARCTFVDSRTGERCDSKHFLEEDHIEPKAMGGDYSLENMRLRCRAHNQRHAIETFGFEKMQGHFCS